MVGRRFKTESGYSVLLFLRIPLKWGTDSGDVGQRRSEATLVLDMISEVPHLSQGFCCK
jgi:hypothetical protein